MNTVPEMDDLDRIMEVMEAAFDPAFGEAWTRRQVSGALAFGNCHYGLATPDGRPPLPGARVAGFYLSRNAFDEEELLLLAVDPACRRRGIGRRLLEQFAASARARGITRLLLEMREGNSAACLYTSFGFQPIGRRPDYYRGNQGTRIDAITMAMSIHSS